MTITFIHNKKAFLPEVDAYSKLFESMGIKCKPALPEEVNRMDTDVEWHFMGVDRHQSKRGRIKIHEYASGSTGMFRGWKNWSKKMLNAKPDFRLFLNPYVRTQFGFKDNIPFGYRDMGIDAEWLNRAGEAPNSHKYDFIYIGDLSAARRPKELLDVFTKGDMKDKTLLVIGSNYAHLQTAYGDFNNIIFKGPFKHSLIPALLQEARFGINYIIDKEPFNQQTSTKFLEYAACGLQVVTTRYKWIEEFTAKYGGEYYYLNPDLSNLKEDRIKNFNFSPPDLSDWTWEKQIKASGVLEFLQARLG